MLHLRTSEGFERPDERAVSLMPSIAGPFALSVLDSSPDCIKLVGLDGTLAYMNRNGLLAMEIDAFGAVEGRRWPDLWPEDSRETLERAIEEARAGRTSVFEAFCPTAKGADRWWNVTVAPVSGPAGEVQTILASSRDITDRVLAARAEAAHEAELEEMTARLAAELEAKSLLLDQQKVLLAEIDHRVKNSFALISGILRLQMRSLGSGEAHDAIEDAANRISTLSKLHEQLHADPDDREIALGPYLTSLVEGLSETLTPEDRTRVRLAGGIDACTAAANAVSFGLITTELVANALKHPRPGQPNDVTVSLSMDASGAGELAVTDTGLGLPPGFDVAQCRGLGMKICSIYAQQLGGTLSCANRLPAGAEFRVRFDLGSAAA